MRPFQAGAVELDLCPFCNGIWFDGGELEQVLKKKLIGTMDPTQQSSRRCPACSIAMNPAELGALRVEVCTQCKGVFLDDGELVALNGGQRITVQGSAKPPPRPQAKVQDDVMDWLNTLGA
jgi:Zn-finger nucleic acid-binding protein